MTKRPTERGSGLAVALAGGLAVILLVPLLLGSAVAGALLPFGLGTATSGHSAGAEITVSGPARGPADTLPAVEPDLGWPWGQCTWFVAQHHRVTWGGNAAEWLANAAAQGAATALLPDVGAIVVYRRGGHYDAVDGHVALVVKASETTYTVAEMNYVGIGVIDERTIVWPDPEVQGFIA